MATETHALKNWTTIAKLLQVQRDLIEKLAAVQTEIDTLLGGGMGLGEKMKIISTSFDTAWCARYRPGEVKGYIWNGKIDGPAMKRLALNPGPEEACKRALRYIQSEEPFFVKDRHSFRLFAHSINQWVAPADAVLETDPDVAEELERTNARRRAMAR